LRRRKLKRDGTTYRGTRAEVVHALEESVVYQEQFGTQAKARGAEVAIACSLGGNDRVQVGPIVYEVPEDQPRSSTVSSQSATVA
jgi:hypothetical protein